jgi:hypothetical protein
MKNKDKVLKHYNSTITDEWSSSAVDMVFESIYTADDYTVYWVHEQEEWGFNPENIYYYAHNVVDDIKGCIKDGLDIFIDSEIYDECYMDDVLEEMWAEIQDEYED